MINKEDSGLYDKNHKAKHSGKDDEFSIKLCSNGPILNLIDKKKLDISQIPEALKIMENQIKTFINFIDEKEKFSRKNLEQQLSMIKEEKELIDKMPSNIENYIYLIKQKITEIKSEKEKKVLLETESATRISQIESKLHQLSEENMFLSKSSILNQCEMLNCMNSLGENTFNIIKNYLSQNVPHLSNINNTMMMLLLKKFEISSGEIENLYSNYKFFLNAIQNLEPEKIPNEIIDKANRDLCLHENIIKEFLGKNSSKELNEILQLFIDYSKSICESFDNYNKKLNNEKMIEKLSQEKKAQNLILMKIRVEKALSNDESLYEDQYKNLLAAQEIVKSIQNQKNIQFKIAEDKLSSFSLEFYNGFPSGISEEEKLKLYQKEKLE